MITGSGIPAAPDHGNPWPKTPHDGMLLPSGQTIGQTDSGALYREFSRLGISDFHHGLGRPDAVEKYASHLSKIGAAGAEKAIAEWLARKRSA